MQGPGAESCSPGLPRRGLISPRILDVNQGCRENSGPPVRTAAFREAIITQTVVDFDGHGHDPGRNVGIVGMTLPETARNTRTVMTARRWGVTGAALIVMAVTWHGKGRGVTPEGTPGASMLR